jgi:hypothetical protein
VAWSPDQIERASSVNAAATRKAGGTSSPSSQGAVALSRHAISMPQIFRHEAEDRRQDGDQSPNTAGIRGAFVAIS